MMRMLGWIALAAALVGVAVWLLVDPETDSVVVQSWRADDPWIIGGSGDPYDYAGEAARTLEGAQATLRIDPVADDDVLDVILSPDAQVAALLGDVQTASGIALHQTFASGVVTWSDVSIHGDTGLGDEGLPETMAQIAGEGSVTVSIDGTPVPGAWTAFWSVGNALRRDDGAIRNQGLIFSPLLRDRTGFSDPERTELTILLYAAANPEALVLELVFPEPILSETTIP